MIGVSLEKLVVVLVVAALVLGPTRLPAYAERLGAWAHGLRAFVDAARARAETGLGVPVRADEWQREVQRYDPRRIVREALAEPAVARVAHPMPDDVGSDGATVEPADRAEPAETGEPAPAVETRTRWVVAGGSSGHPRRIRVVEPIEPQAEPTAAQAATSASDRSADASVV